jgi:hypothetical protein
MDSRTPWLHLGALALVAACGQEPPEAEPLESSEAPATFVGGNALLTNPASVCWVLPPGSPVDQAELDRMQANVEEWTHGDTSLRFNFASDLSSFHDLIIGGITYRTNCTRRSNGKFSETLRIYVDHASYPDRASAYPDHRTVPGCSFDEIVGTQARNPNGTPKMNGSLFVAEAPLWSMFPQQLIDNKRCLYTTHFHRGQARNNYQHEIGHSLGLAHEHVRTDATCQPVSSEPDEQLKVTIYDRDSVMHYVIKCTDGTTATGNWGDTGPSASDRLAVEILYPRDNLASIWGHLTGWVGANNLDAASLWLLRGALPDSADGVLGSFRWRIDGQQVSTRAWPTRAELAAPAGRHTLSVEYKDRWNRSYSGAVVLEQLPSQADYMARAGALVGPL